MIVREVMSREVIAIAIALLEEALMVGVVIVLMGDHQVLVIAGAPVLITVVPAAQFMTGTTVQCMTGAGVLNMEGMRVLNTADTAGMFLYYAVHFTIYRDFNCL